MNYQLLTLSIFIAFLAGLIWYYGLAIWDWIDTLIVRYHARRLDRIVNGKRLDKRSKQSKLRKFI